MDAAVWTLIAIVGVVVVAAFVARLFDRVTVFEFERAVRYRRGKFAGVLAPGQYWLFRPWTLVRKVDVRPRVVAIPGQEVLSSDGVTLRVSLVAEFEIADPAVAVNEVEDFATALYTTLQLALREIVGGTEIEQLLEARGEIGKRLTELANERAESLGLKLHSVDLRDIMFPGDLKKMFAQVVGARKEGQAALEKARGETAALRNLANAARLMEGNPSLLQLRLLQQMGVSGGNTIVVGLPGSATPLPLRPAEGEEPDRGELPEPE
jgi:regulator of protease activity HflC (stomatin/prohibitin superfamily)